MLLRQLRYIPFVKSRLFHGPKKLHSMGSICERYQKANLQEAAIDVQPKDIPCSIAPASEAPPQQIVGPIYPARMVSMMLTNKEPVVLSFDEVPGPKSLKYLANIRQYLSNVGTQVTASALTIGLNIGSYLENRKPIKNLTTLFDEYGPVVRFVSPVGGDIVLLNHPEHIQKVFALEGECPIRSSLDSLEKYRSVHRNHIYAGLFNVSGQEWAKQRIMVYSPLQESVSNHLLGLIDVCESFVSKIYNIRNQQDEVTKDLYKELHKWAFDCMGLIVFSKRFTMLETDKVSNQCDMSWLYHSLEKATNAIAKCESGMHMWKLFKTPSWLALVKHCDSLDNLIGKHVMEAEHEVTLTNRNTASNNLITAMLLGEQKLSTEDICTVLMDILLIGVNTITSSMSFLAYNLAKHQKYQKQLFQEIEKIYPNLKSMDAAKLKKETPYLQACIKETLRLVPPIPVISRILPKNITLDRYNIPRGTLLIMSTQDAALKESNYDDATRFNPERWLSPDSKDYHVFASIPFGYGARKCMAQDIAETMMSLITIKMIQKYKLEYHYGDIQPSRGFIARPNKPLKIRFIDRI